MMSRLLVIFGVYTRDCRISSIKSWFIFQCYSIISLNVHILIQKHTFVHYIYEHLTYFQLWWWRCCNWPIWCVNEIKSVPYELHRTEFTFCSDWLVGTDKIHKEKEKKCNASHKNNEIKKMFKFQILTIIIVRMTLQRLAAYPSMLTNAYG